MASNPIPFELGMSADQQEAVILICSILSIIFGLYNVCRVLSVKVHSYGRGGDIELQDSGTTSDEAVEHQMMEVATLI